MKHGGERGSARRSCFMGRRCQAPGSVAELSGLRGGGPGSWGPGTLQASPPVPLSAYAERGDEGLDQVAEVGL